MTFVHLRAEYDVESHLLGDIPFDQLEDVIPMLKRWGVSTDANDNPEMYGQFVYPSTGPAYFEVVLSDGDDS